MGRKLKEYGKVGAIASLPTAGWVAVKPAPTTGVVGDGCLPYGIMRDEGKLAYNGWAVAAVVVRGGSK